MPLAVPTFGKVYEDFIISTIVDSQWYFANSSSVYEDFIISTIVDHVINNRITFVSMRTS